MRRFPAYRCALRTFSAAVVPSHNFGDAELIAIGDLDHSRAVTNADLQGLQDRLIPGSGSVTAVPGPASLSSVVPALIIGCADSQLLHRLRGPNNQLRPI